MAVLLQADVQPATRDQHDELGTRIEHHLIQLGGAPSGLMSHVVYPEGGGFVIADVWRTEAEGRSFLDEVLQPVLTESGLTIRGVTVHPVWKFARP